MDAPLRAPVHVVVMGVSATGKTTVAKALAEMLSLEFIEGDDFHTPHNLKKMAEGDPLTDEDREPWLRTLASMIEQRDAAGVSTVLTCSALRRPYRDILRTAKQDLYFIHLHADFDCLLERMSQREKHFMPSSLLQSQFDTLEPLEDDEEGAVVDVSPPLEQVVAAAAWDVRAIDGR